MKVLVSFVVVAALFSALVAADTVTIRPDGQGNWDGWKNNNCDKDFEWECVDEVTANTSDYLETTTEKKETFTFTSTGLASETINDITLYYLAKENNNQNHICFETLIREGGTDYLGGTTICGNETWEIYSQTFSTNPATSSAWTVSEVNALEAGMSGMKTDAGAEIAQVYAVVDYTATIPDTCSDSDGGNAPFTAGTVTGNASGSPFSNDDTCINSTHLTEWTCSGTSAQSVVIDCEDETTNPVACIAGRCLELG